MQPEQDITFEEFIQEALLYPCPCEDCQDDLQFDTPDRAQQYLNQLLEIWETLITPSDGYDAPPTSPTNHQMHAINGNIKTPFVQDVADVINGFRDAYNELPDIYERFRGRGKHSSEDAMHHYKEYFANHPSGKFFDAGTPEYEKWLSTYEKFLESSKLKKTKKITNKQQHTINGNLRSLTKSQPKWEWKPNHGEQENIDPVDNTQELYEQLQSGNNPAQLVMSSGPSNKEMHAYNGNPPKFGPRTKAQHERIQRKKIRNAKKRAQTKIKKGRAPPQTRPKLPKGVKQAAKIEKLEMKIARKYASFLRSPSFKPPRLGSSGNKPTNLVHGYFRKSYNMSAPYASVVNATCLTATINPVLFNQYISVSDYVSPIVVGFSTTPDIKPSTNNATANFELNNFYNVEALYRQVLGSNNVNTSNPLARYLGGSICIECRCPMTTTAPPFLFGGLLQEYTISTAGDTIKKDSQLMTFTPAQVRNLPESDDKNGFVVSSVYQPCSANDLLFNRDCARYVNADPRQPPSPIPYVGMVNCPTSAVVTVTVSGWFEIMENVYVDGNTVTTADYGGWDKGPKISAEDVFDNLPKIQSVTTRLLGMGTKSNMTSMAALVAAREREEHPPQPSIYDELQILKKEISQLKLQIEEEEDEKYFEYEATQTLDKQETPIYKNLSKSTIDLAINLKKSLTPGSVTNKTIQNSFQ